MTSTPPLGRFHEVDGRRLLLHRSGAGTPSVVFLSGGGTFGLDYLNLQVRAAEYATSVLYDRGGTGWSDPVDLPRASADAVAELHALLHSADVPGPYLLVGHSLGGFYARHYAHLFPEEVAGLVLLDPAHEDYRAHMPAELVKTWDAWDPEEAVPTDLPAEMIAYYRAGLGEMFSAWPDDVREPLIDHHVTPSVLLTGIKEASNIEALNDELRATGPMPDVPLIILSSTDIDDFKRAVSGGTPESLLREEIEGKARLYDTVAASVTKGEHRTVEGAGHVTLPVIGEEAAVRAIRDLLGK